MSQITSYSWDEENRLIGVLNPDSSADTYVYAGDGKRRSKDTLAGLISYVWDNENVLQEMDGSTVKAHYTDSPGYWGGLTSFRDGNNDSFYYLFDQQASTREVLDDTGGTLDAFVYRAFGEKEYESVTTNNRHEFQGQAGPFSEASNRIWMRQRIYSGDTKQWLSADPIGFDEEDWNLYRFIFNNPANQTDPTGYGPAEKCWSYWFAHYSQHSTPHAACVQAQRLCKVPGLNCEDFPNRRPKPKPLPTPTPTPCPSSPAKGDPCKNTSIREDCDHCNSNLHAKCVKQAIKSAGKNIFTRTARLGACHYVLDGCTELCIGLGTDEAGQGPDMVACWKIAKKIQDFANF